MITNKWLKPRRHLEVARDPWYQQLAELQDALSILTYQHWSAQGYKTIHLPITTGAISSPMGRGSDSSPVAVEICGVRTYLADSMQFALEYGCRCVGTGCYYVMPSFRGEPADETHLCQFYHSEVELPGSLETCVTLAEAYLRFLCRGIVARFATCCLALKDQLDHVAQLGAATEAFPRMTFDQACRLLKDRPEFVRRDTETGIRTLTRAGERQLLLEHGAPLWIVYFDHLAVPFYQAYADGDRTKARNADLLLGAGEVIGLGERHVNGDQVRDALTMHGVEHEPYAWYLQMKDEFPLQSSGFGMGIERFLMWVLSHNDIRDLQLVPRFNGVKHEM